MVAQLPGRDTTRAGSVRTVLVGFDTQAAETSQEEAEVQLIHIRVVVEMGIRAGVKACVGVLTGFATAEEFRPLTPFIARDVSEISVRRKNRATL